MCELNASKLRCIQLTHLGQFQPPSTRVEVPKNYDAGRVDGRHGWPGSLSACLGGGGVIGRVSEEREAEHNRCHNMAG